MNLPAEFLKSYIEDNLFSNNIHPTILLTGEMGAGKTTFTSIFVNLFQKNLEDFNVNSPTFNLYNVYETSPIDIYHFDLYRLKEASELENLEIEEIWGRKGITIIEWWQIARDYLPENCIEVRILTDPAIFAFRDLTISSDARTFWDAL